MQVFFNVESCFYEGIALGTKPRVLLPCLCTVKLGYNSHDYNEFKFTMIRILSHFWSQMTIYNVNVHGYSESRLQETFFAGSREFVIT